MSSVVEPTLDPAVEVIDLRKVFRRGKPRARRRVAALDGVSFTVARGETVAILGQNGSGKTTPFGEVTAVERG